MSKPAPKISLAAPQTIPLDKLVLHDGNVRRIKAGVSIENLAADIERRGLLQSLSVRPLLTANGEETGTYACRPAVAAWPRCNSSSRGRGSQRTLPFPASCATKALSKPTVSPKSGA